MANPLKERVTENYWKKGEEISKFEFLPNELLKFEFLPNELSKFEIFFIKISKFEFFKDFEAISSAVSLFFCLLTLWIVYRFAND